EAGVHAYGEVPLAFERGGDHRHLAHLVMVAQRGDHVAYRAAAVARDQLAASRQAAERGERRGMRRFSVHLREVERRSAVPPSLGAGMLAHIGRGAIVV